MEAGGDSNLPEAENSLLCGVGKVFERLILKRLIKIVTERNLIPEEQFGFSKGCSAPANMYRQAEYRLCFS